MSGHTTGITVDRQEVDSLLRFRTGAALKRTAQLLADLLTELDYAVRHQLTASALLSQIRESERLAQTLYLTLAEREESLLDLDMLLDETAEKGGTDKT